MNAPSNSWDIIPDIHGHAEKLESMLSLLGYARSNGCWRHDDRTRTAIFLGDYIDRGPNNAAVIDIVRRMVDAGTAQAIMGNHELNAIHFHTLGERGLPLRARSRKNIEQHAAFLKEFPIGAPETKDAITWMQSLPMFLDLNEFRVVHASWHVDAVSTVERYAKKGRLDSESFIHAADPSHSLSSAVETLAKGPELTLPEGYSIRDKGNHLRRNVRVKWWREQASRWKDIAISVPNMDELPDATLPLETKFSSYAPTEKPVFFGHYWLSGQPKLQASNALCLDYSVGKGGPLTSYLFLAGDDNLDLRRISQV